MISGNQESGVYIYGSSATNNLLVSNLIGTDLTGTKALGNGDSGVIIADGASNNTIGGPSAGDANLISGNTYNSTKVTGVELYGSGTTGNVVEGNLIGTDVTGKVSLGNAADGLSIFGGASNNTIGGPTDRNGNVISGNGTPADTAGGFGVSISGTGTSGNIVIGNLIGTDPTVAKPG